MAVDNEIIAEKQHFTSAKTENYLYAGNARDTNRLDFYHFQFPLSPFETLPQSQGFFLDICFFTNGKQNKNI